MFLKTEPMYSIYILYSESGNKYYVGSSQNPQLRLGFHNTIERGFTARYRPWKMVYVHRFDSKSQAQKAERKVKGWKSRNMIEETFMLSV